MKKRYVTAEDYQELSRWWKDWGWHPVPQNCLAPTGLMIENDGVPVCAVWLYRTDSPVCWAEYYVSSKDAAPEVRRMALDFLIGCIVDEATEMGFKFVMSSVKHNSLCRKLENNGFLQSDQGMTHYIKVL